MATRRRYGNTPRRLFPSNRANEVKPKSKAPAVSSSVKVERSELSNLYATINDGEDIFTEIAKSEVSEEILEKEVLDRQAPKKELYVREMVKKIKTGEIDYQKLIQLREQLQYKQNHPSSEIYLTKEMAALLKKIDKAVRKIYQKP